MGKLGADLALERSGTKLANHPSSLADLAGARRSGVVTTL